MGILYYTWISCKTLPQKQWATETMEALSTLAFGDWFPKDLALVKENLSLDEDDIYEAPNWDLCDNKFWLYSGPDHYAELDIVSIIIQEYLIKFFPKKTHILGYSKISADKNNLHSGGALFISADEIKMYDGMQLAHNHKLEHNKKNLPKFGTFDNSNKHKQKVWWYSILGTQIKRFEAKKPISKEAVFGILKKKYVLQNNKDAEVWKKKPKFM